MQDRTSTSPLEGVRVLDFSIMLAGPYCARLLADVGAEVIKIEPPEGDEMRLRAPVRDGHSAYFGQLNAGKRSIALDLKSSDAIKLVHRMVENTDILVENFRPGVMDRLGLGYEALRKINPRDLLLDLRLRPDRSAGRARRLCDDRPCRERLRSRVDAVCR
jgi:CoA:oxalate CoA-transferase